MLAVGERKGREQEGLQRASVAQHMAGKGMHRVELFAADSLNHWADPVTLVARSNLWATG